jgi:hypothetical protein
VCRCYNRYNIASVLKLVFTNPKAVLLGPVQCSFRFCSEIVGQYVSVVLTESSGTFGTGTVSTTWSTMVHVYDVPSLFGPQISVGADFCIAIY